MGGLSPSLALKFISEARLMKHACLDSTITGRRRESQFARLMHHADPLPIRFHAMGIWPAADLNKLTRSPSAHIPSRRSLMAGELSE